MTCWIFILSNSKLNVLIYGRMKQNFFHTFDVLYDKKIVFYSYKSSNKKKK